MDRLLLSTCFLSLAKKKKKKLIKNKIKNSEQSMDPCGTPAISSLNALSFIIYHNSKTYTTLNTLRETVGLQL